ncbi:hypothetical protein L6164_028658 [Bauhinia variegata]|uniref:Uncharacterized protein n=1 Tax=Bauhinia variegata TaxID=167791 RepID=A0ACB9L6Z2_BAUVA|nr:hypothetical protein L6164_028658 [Bauhinia variegata]
MKFSTSYSSPASSSSSTLAFDPAMCTSKSATAGRLIAILRRILCSRGLPTHPSYQITELDSIVLEKDQELKTQKKKVEEAAAIVSLNTLGIVARLMGLDSMVERETPSSSSVSRSRSMNSMQGLHKRVKSTLSFREVPPFVELENENFFILCFENVRESKEFRSKGKKTEMGSVELRQKRSERKKMKENRRENVSPEKILHENGKLQEITNTLSQFKVSSEAGKFSEELKRKKKKKKKKKISCSTENKIELDSNSEESSPVSVLDFERKAHQSDADSCEIGLSSRRKLSTELENEQQCPLLFDGNLMVEERKIKGKIGKQKYDNGSNSKRMEKQSMDICNEVFRLVGDDLVGSEGIESRMWKHGDSHGLSADFESEIFDHLLGEFIDQLVGHPLKTL